MPLFPTNIISPSVPCVPVNVQGVVDCSAKTLQTSWDAAAGAVSYISTLRGPGNVSTDCSTTDQRCVFPGLQCAQTYTFSVVSRNDRCNSSNSNIISARTGTFTFWLQANLSLLGTLKLKHWGYNNTCSQGRIQTYNSNNAHLPCCSPAPCDPKDVTADLNCLSGVVTVTWGTSAGANYYTVLAETSRFFDSCNSTSTSCQLSQLQCGEDYTVTVLAGDGKCNSSIYTKINVTTGKGRHDKWRVFMFVVFSFKGAIIS